jgi:hypothetical protein
MSPQTILIGLALFGSLVLLARHRPIIFPLIAVIVSAFEALMAFHLITFSVARVPLGLVFGILLTLSGVLVHMKATTKTTVTASTIVAVVGGLQTLATLHLH